MSARSPLGFEPGVLRAARHTVVEAQRLLHARAVAKPSGRFDGLWPLVVTDEVLVVALADVARNKGAKTAGVDGATINDIWAPEFIPELRSALVDGSYHPSPVRVASVPKADGRRRRLGIPTLADRVVQRALHLLVEPLFEADFMATSFGGRPGLGPYAALGELHRFLEQPRADLWALNIDVEHCFGSIPQERLLARLGGRVADDRVLDLVGRFMRAGEVEGGEFSLTPTGVRQGGPISPLLANLYLHQFDVAMATDISQSELMLRYTDDILLVVQGLDRAQRMFDAARRFIEQLGLHISVKKSSITPIEHGVSFVGHFFLLTAGAVEIHASMKSLGNLANAVEGELKQHSPRKPLAPLIARLNSLVEGWAQYFCFTESGLLWAHRIVQQLVFDHLRRRNSDRRIRRSFIGPHGQFKDGKVELVDPRLAYRQEQEIPGRRKPPSFTQGLMPEGHPQSPATDSSCSQQEEQVGDDMDDQHQHDRWLPSVGPGALFEMTGAPGRGAQRQEDMRMNSDKALLRSISNYTEKINVESFVEKWRSSPRAMKHLHGPGIDHLPPPGERCPGFLPADLSGMTNHDLGNEMAKWCNWFAFVEQELERLGAEAADAETCEQAFLAEVHRHVREAGYEASLATVREYALTTAVYRELRRLKGDVQAEHRLLKARSKILKQGYVTMSRIITLRQSEADVTRSSANIPMRKIERLKVRA